MRRRIFAFVVVACGLSLAACQHGPQVEQKPRVFQKKGGVVFLGGSASWDEDEIVGPLITVAQRADGSWAGTINGQVIDVNVYKGRAAGSYLTMRWKVEGEAKIITAHLNGRLHRFEVYPDRIEVRQPTRSFTLGKRADGSYGPGSELKFEGDGNQVRPPMPQFGFALLATFAATEAVMRDASGDPTPMHPQESQPRF